MRLKERKKEEQIIRTYKYFCYLQVICLYEIFTNILYKQIILLLCLKLNLQSIYELQNSLLSEALPFLFRNNMMFFSLLSMSNHIYKLDLK